MPNDRARANPSDCGSIPVSRANSMWPGLRRILNIRSLPILPEPRMATLTLLFPEVLIEIESPFECPFVSAMSVQAVRNHVGLIPEPESIVLLENFPRHVQIAPVFEDGFQAGIFHLAHIDH